MTARNPRSTADLPPLVIRAGEGVESASIRERADAYRERGESEDAAVSAAAADALDSLRSLGMGPDGEQADTNTDDK